MRFKPKLSSDRRRHVAYLYAVVFNSAFSGFLVFFLLASFMLQPLHQAYANEPVEPAEIAEETIEPLQAESVAMDHSSVSESDLSDPTLQSLESTTQTDEPDTTSLPDTPPVSAESLASEQAFETESADSTISSSTISTSTTATTTATDSELDQTVGDTVDNEEQSTLDQDDDQDESSQDTDQSAATASTSDNVVFAKAESLVTEDNFYQFNRQACVAIGDGTYHCSTKNTAGVDSNSVVYSEIGPNQNLEIFLRTSDDEVRQLTTNDFDDSSPHYDADSMQIVWQRLIDDRYQIVLYDIVSETETQLTYSRTNNMEPKVAIEGVVWQSWDGNDWEIMYFDGKYTDQLTDNAAQDVAPAISDGYILWSVLSDNEQEAKVYSLQNGETLSINGYEGGVIANPRFVLVYDTKFDNGDVVTQGFDPVTGLSTPIAAQPGQDPINIPDTDSTGETRALIQNKSTQKDEFEAEDGTVPPNAGSDGLNVSATSSTSTLNLKAATSSVISATTTVVQPPEPVFELTDYDLIITAPTTTPDAQVGTTNSSAS